jgi:hypothetical protein
MPSSARDAPSTASEAKQLSSNSRLHRKRCTTTCFLVEQLVLSTPKQQQETEPTLGRLWCSSILPGFRTLLISMLACPSLFIHIHGMWLIPVTPYCFVGVTLPSTHLSSVLCICIYKRYLLVQNTSQHTVHTTMRMHKHLLSTHSLKYLYLDSFTQKRIHTHKGGYKLLTDTQTQMYTDTSFTHMVMLRRIHQGEVLCLELDVTRCRQTFGLPA